MSVNTLATIAGMILLAGCSAPASDEVPHTEAGSPTPVARGVEPAPAQGASDAQPPPPHVGHSPEPGTKIFDQAAADRLLGAKGVTLQWISWDRRGPIRVRDEEGTIRLNGGQVDERGGGELNLDGEVTEIGPDYFTFVGTIRITDAPDPGRTCEATKPWYFAITQNRPYWRLREFEWCDDLTDYVDIHF